MTYLRHIAIPLIVILLTCSLAGCGGRSTATPGEEALHEDDVHPHSEMVLGYNLVQVKMHPAESVDPPFAAGELGRVISSPAQLSALLPPLHGVSFNDADLVKAGVKYEASLPNSLVAPDGGDPNALQFDPDWQNGLEGAAYCVYRFPLADYGASTREQTLGFEFGSKLPADPPVYIGYGDINGNGGWDWFQAEQDGILTLEDYGKYEFPDGSVLIAFVVLGHTPLVLHELTVGAFELRGTGGDDPVQFSPPAPLWPDFPLQAIDMVDLSPYAGPVGDQDGSASCTAWAATGACQYELATLYGDCGWDLDLPAFRLSPRYVYIKTGSSPESCPGGGRGIYGAAEWIRDNGAAREVTAPFFTTEAEPPDKPNPFWGFHCTQSWDPFQAFAEAQLFRPDVTAFIGTEDPVSEDYYLNAEQINFAKAVLKILRRPLGMNTRLDSNFGSVDYAGGESWTFSGVSGGGLSHAMLIVGYDENRNGGSFKLKNSWGVNWGDEGYCWITYASMMDDRSNAYAYFVVDSFDQDIADEYCAEPPPYLPPFGLMSPARHPDYIEIEWEKVLGAQEYLIYRDDSEEIFATVLAENNSYKDINVPDRYTHVYWVRVLGDGGESPLSAPLFAWLEPPPG